MPEVIGPTGEVINLPEKLNGVDIRKTLNIPDNKVVTRVSENGNETLVRDSDQVTVNPGDKFDTTTTFDRG